MGESGFLFSDDKGKQKKELRKNIKAWISQDS